MRSLRVHKAPLPALLLLLLACGAAGVQGLTVNPAARPAGGAVAAAAAAAGVARHRDGHRWGHNPQRPSQTPANLDNPEGKACLFTPGVLLFQNDKPNSTELADSPAWNDWYVKSGGCANEDIAKYYPQDVPACRACHAAMTRRACLAIQAANEYNALSMSCTWRGPQQKADSRTTRPGGRQPQPKAMEVLWSVGINEPSGFLHTLANDTCSVTAEFETDRQSASRFQARLNWQMLGPAKTPDGNTPAGLNRDVSCMLYGNKRKCSYTINRPAFSKYLWLNNQFTTRDQAVIANLASIPYDCFYAKNCTTAFSFKYNMRLTEHPCKPGTAPRFAAVSQGSLLTSNYATALLPGKEGLSGDSFSIGYFPLVGAKAARWNLSWGRSPTLSPIIALLNTTNLWAKACTADSKDPAVYVCDFHKLRPWAIGNRWCTKRTCADQILEMPQLNDHAIMFVPYANYVFNSSNNREAVNPAQTPPVELFYNEYKVWA